MAALVKTCRTCGREFAQGETFCPTDGTRLFSTQDPALAPGADEHLVGQTLDGRYRIIEVIGQGGMGIVYEAEHVLIEKRVAVKVLRQDFTRKPDVVERFRQEARSASKIGHPNIIDVIDFGETPSGASYFVMEKLEGEDLAEVLCRECVLAPARAVNLIYQCCRALSAAHAKGIFHRDLKPENLFLVRTPAGAESVKIVDFGVAKMSDLADDPSGSRRLTRTGMLFGTPEYMSPEQARGMQLDHRADIYALGIILYELVTGRVPFEGSNFMEVLSKHGTEPLPELTVANPGTIVSEALRAVVLRALCKDREVRFQSMDEMAEALAAVPEMPSNLGDTPPPWALAVPSSPTEGAMRQRVSGEPMHEVTPGRARLLWESLGAPLRLAVVATGGVLLGLVGYWAIAGSGDDGTQTRRASATRPSTEDVVFVEANGDKSAKTRRGASGVDAVVVLDEGAGSERSALRVAAGQVESEVVAAGEPRAETAGELRGEAAGAGELPGERAGASEPRGEAAGAGVLPGERAGERSQEGAGEQTAGAGSGNAAGSANGQNAAHRLLTEVAPPARVPNVGSSPAAPLGRPLTEAPPAHPQSPSASDNHGPQAGPSEGASIFAERGQAGEAGSGDQATAGNGQSGAKKRVRGGKEVAQVEADTAVGNIVRIQVLTRPAGARVMAGHEHDGCRATPCYIWIPRGKQAVIKARHGRLRGSSRVVARNSGQQVWVMMARADRDIIPPPASRNPIPPPVVNEGPRERVGNAPSTSRPGEVTHGGDLKIPDIFR